MIWLYDNQTDIFRDVGLIIKVFDNQAFWDVWLIIKSFDYFVYKKFTVLILEDSENMDPSKGNND